MMQTIFRFVALAELTLHAPDENNPLFANGLLLCLPITLLTGCVLFQGPPRLTGNRAFIVYWPPVENTNQLRLAVKDNIDMKGVVTTAGSEYLTIWGKPATNDAACPGDRAERNVQIVGKANMSRICRHSFRL
jgi:amidase